MRNLYRLHSVLVHSGVVHGGRGLRGFGGMEWSGREGGRIGAAGTGRVAPDYQVVARFGGPRVWPLASLACL